MRYFYDATGIAGFTYNGTLYYYGKDALGNVRKIYDVNMNLVGSYDYDGFGSITNGLTTIASINPIRWKSHYYDVETGWYNINSRYYDPSIAQYITVSEAEDLLQEIGSLQGWNRYQLSKDNVVCIASKDDKIFFANFDFSPNYWLPIRFFGDDRDNDLGFLRYIIWGLALVAFTVVAIINPGAAFGILVASAKAALTAFLFTLAVEGVLAIHGLVEWENIFKDAAMAAIDSFFITMLVMSVATIVSTIAQKVATCAKATQKPAATSSPKAEAQQIQAIDLTGMTSNELGKMGEDYVGKVEGLNKNKQLFDVDGRGRIPDFVSSSRNILIESKNVARQGYTKQLRDYVKIAESQGWTMKIYVRTNTKLSGAIQKAIKLNKITVCYFTW